MKHSVHKPLFAWVTAKVIKAMFGYITC